MSIPKPQKPSIAQVLKLVEQLTPDEQSELRKAFLEDEEDARIALERLKEPGRLWSLDELEQGIDLAG
jgi:hypothetical protein